jgi:NAD(P)-dependent dehydrogenase (short-subunit alcohol dehydrogenase family)
MSEYAGRVIVISGAGSGIGRATAILFGQDKAAVVVLDWNGESARSTVEEIERGGGVGLALEVDVSNSQQVKAAVAQAVEKFGRIDILFANAAVQIIKPIELTTDEDWEHVISANLKGSFVCCREVVPVMRRQRSGCILIASSGHAFHSYPGYTAYAASKGGQLAMMRAMAIDCAPDGIRVNCIIPGATETALLKAHFENNPEEKERLVAKIPMGRLAAPEDIARAVRMLASEDAGFLTGQSVVVDGGLLARN